jgi:hypothetical protein
MNWTLKSDKSYEPPRRKYELTIEPYTDVTVKLLLEESRPNKFTVWVFSNGKGFYAKRRKTDRAPGMWSVSVAKQHALQCAFSSAWLESFGYDLASIKEFAA